MIRYFAEHPTAANLLMIIFLVVGLFSIPHLRRETFPDFVPTEIEVHVLYHGASAEEVEEVICQRIEDALDRVNFVHEMRSEAREGIGTVVVEMQEDGSLQAFMNDIRSAIDAIDDLPDDAKEPVITELHTASPVVSVAVTGDMAPWDLKALAESLEDRLARYDEISRVTHSGFSDHQFGVSIDETAANRFGLSASDIAAIIRQQNIDLPGGILATPNREFLVRFKDERHSPAEIENLLILGGELGGEVRLGDIAQVRDRFEKEEEKILVRMQNEHGLTRAALLNTEITDNRDVLRAFDSAREFLRQEEARMPPGVDLVLTRDAASIVKDRLTMLVKNGWQGLVLVFLTLWLFFNLRFSFWVTLGLPTAFIGGLFFIQKAGFSLNMITMVGLLVAIGLMMDDAIVIGENIASHIQRGSSALEAVIHGTSEVKAGVISSFLTTVVVFGPLSFLEGQIGRVLRVMPATLIFILGVSLIEAFWILPHHLGHGLKKRGLKRTARLRQSLDTGLEWIRERIIGRFADFAISQRWIFSGVVVGLFLATLGLLAGGKVKFQAFPEIDGDIMEARITLPQGTPLDRTEQLVQHMVKALDRVDAEYTPRQPGQQQLVRRVLVEYGKNVDAFETGPHVATVSVDLLTAEERNARLDNIMTDWRREIGSMPDLMNLKIDEPALGPAGRPLDIRLSGEELADLDEASRQMQRWLNQFKGVYDLSDDLRPGKPEVVMKLRDGAITSGIDAYNLADQIRSAVQGKIASDIQVEGEPYEVSVRLSEQDLNSISDLANLRVRLPNGQMAPLLSVATLRHERNWARIARVDGRRTVSIQGDVNTLEANTAEIIMQMNRNLLPKLKEQYPDLKVTIEGETGEAATTGKSLLRSFLIGIIGIFVLLSFQFRSYIEPVVVMLAIPFAFIGVVWGHVLMGYSLTMPSMLGFVSLAGITVNDSILLVEFLKRRQAEGMDVMRAASQASRDRFRAVLLTSLTTIAGLLPLLLEKSLQAQILIPLAISIIFGLLASTILVLFFVPSFYTLIYDLSRAKNPNQ